MPLWMNSLPTTTTNSKLIVQLSVLLSIFFLASTTGLFISSSLNVTLNHGGILIGRHLTSHHGRNVRGFLGIPYAKPPVGELRFKAPVPADPWTGERMATTDGNVCSQVDVLFNFLEYSGVEDCLYLNVYVPEEPKSKGPLPVMVWIHGGGFVLGTGMQSFYDPKLLMDRDIVLVSFNYRLGTIGFLSSETLDIPGNFGLKDQLLALKWVQEHISAFGGDPNNVTIFGVSCGASSVVYMTNSDKTQGLFHRAIAQSGSVFNRWAEPVTNGIAANISRKVAGVVGCANETDTWPTILECLREVPVQNLTEAANEFLVWRELPLPILPVVVEPEHEDAFLTEVPVISNTSNSVPMMMGYNTNEGLFVYGFTKVSPIDQLADVYENSTAVFLNYQNSPKENYPKLKALVDDFYFKNGTINYQNLTDLLSDAWIISGVDRLLIERSTALPNAAPTYFYNFDNNGLSFSYYANDEFLGTFHFDELMYLYPLNDFLLPTMAPTKTDSDLREIFLDLWYNFASQGNPTPSGSKYPNWAPVSSYPPTLMRIGSQKEGEPLLKTTSEYPTARLQFWRDLQPYLAN